MVSEEYPEVIRKHWKSSLTSLWDPCHPERNLCRIRKSLTFSTFPSKPHDPHGILGTFHIWNRGLYPWGIRESVTGPLHTVLLSFYHIQPKAIKSTTLNTQGIHNRIEYIHISPEAIHFGEHIISTSKWPHKFVKIYYGCTLVVEWDVKPQLGIVITTTQRTESQKISYMSGQVWLNSNLHRTALNWQHQLIHNYAVSWAISKTSTKSNWLTLTSIEIQMKAFMGFGIIKRIL